MDQPQPLNLIRLGNELIATNGNLKNGELHFPENDPAEEVFAADDKAPIISIQGLTSPRPLPR